MRLLGASGLAAGLGGVVTAADAPNRPTGNPPRASHPPALVVDGKVVQPQRELTVLHETDVLVVGGGPAGVVAALAARRAGVRVTLVERYGHFGGLWTGGLTPGHR